jgi:hypothetical protein
VYLAPCIRRRPLTGRPLALIQHRSCSAPIFSSYLNSKTRDTSVAHPYESRWIFGARPPPLALKFGTHIACNARSVGSPRAGWRLVFARRRRLRSAFAVLASGRKHVQHGRCLSLLGLAFYVRPPLLLLTCPISLSTHTAYPTPWIESVRLRCHLALIATGLILLLICGRSRCASKSSP